MKMYEAYAGDGEEFDVVYFDDEQSARKWCRDQHLSDTVTINSWHFFAESPAAIMNRKVKQHNFEMVYRGDADKA